MTGAELVLSAEFVASQRNWRFEHAAACPLRHAGDETFAELQKGDEMVAVIGAGPASKLGRNVATPREAFE